MKRNETELIKSTSKRKLTSKGLKLISKIQDLACEKYGYTRYHKETREMKYKIKDLVTSLVIDYKMSKDEVIDFISSSFKNKSKKTSNIFGTIK